MSVSEEKKMRTRSQLIDSEVEVFQKQGCQKAPVSDIVIRAGVAQGNILPSFQIQIRDRLYHRK